MSVHLDEMEHIRTRLLALFSSKTVLDEVEVGVEGSLVVTVVEDDFS